MDIWSLLQWWEEWQLRILVLSSLGVKCILALLAGTRKSHVPPILRFAIWLSYLGGDALAIYALATLLNIQKKLRYSSVDTGSHDLQVLWAPIMLMHLGGLTNISAYNIEDNELWRRHIVTAVSQVAVAIYVFCKLWSSSADKRLLATAILLFIPGIFKCFEKPLALKRASFHSLVSQPDSLSKADNVNIKRSELDLEECIQKELDLEVYIQEAKKAFGGAKYKTAESGGDDLRKLLNRPQKKWENIYRPDNLFVDLAYPYSERRRTLKSFWVLKDPAAYEAIGVGLYNTFKLLYTKDYTMDTKGRNEHVFDNGCSFFTWIFSLLLPISAIGLFHSSHKEAYRGSDVKITFILLYVTLFADICSFYTLDSPWYNKVAQQNLIALFTSKKRNAWLTSIARRLQCTDFLEQRFSMEPCDSSLDITNLLVRRHIIDGWENYILDAEGYRNFSDIRGHRTLERKGCEHAFRWSLEMPFDETILLWHVATDFCFHHKVGTSPASGKAANKEKARQISNYMMHLLFANPEMLMPGSRRNLCAVANEEIEKIFKDNNEAPVKEKDVAQNLLKAFDSGKVQQEGFIYTAWLVAQGLIRLHDEQKMWEVLEGVWVEMLCFSASRCRGYLHAKNLGSGGEYLSIVWLLMAHAGLETFPERQQRVRLQLPNDVRVKQAKERIEEEAARKKNERKDKSSWPGCCACWPVS